ncbi:dihydrofolate reductase family protein [Streptomyces sp. NPDC002851]
MAKVSYWMTMSLDGYIEDANGSIAFSAPDEEVHRAANEQARNASAFLFGRRLYEVMEEPWTTAAAEPDELPDVEAEFARVYVDTPRYVFSDTLTTVPDGVTLVRSTEAPHVVRRLKKESTGDLSVGGPSLAASLLDLIDEFCVYVAPVALGAGKPYFQGARPVGLRLLEHRVFTSSGTVLLRYGRKNNRA